MPIQHTVVFRLAHHEGSEQERGFLVDARAVLTSIPGVTEFTVKRQVSPKSDLVYQFSTVFADEVAYREYNDHPAHIEFVAQRWIPEVANFQEYDFVEA